MQHSKACPFANHFDIWSFLDKAHDFCRVYFWAWLTCLSTREVKITLQLYILNIQDIFCWNRSQDNHLSHWQDVWPSTVMNKRLIFLFLFVLHSDLLCLVHLELLATCSRVEREDPLYFLSQSPPVLTLRKSSFLAVCRRTWEIFILHTKPNHLYITMQVLYRRFCVPLL